jgi:aryl-alcohol dehydrogenase-like predicted oxidoreductase
MGPCLWRWRESTRLFRAFATAPIGASSVEQLEDNLAALQNLSFSEAELKEVD